MTDTQTHRHRITAKAALDASIARQKRIAQANNRITTVDKDGHVTNQKSKDTKDYNNE